MLLSNSLWLVRNCSGWFENEAGVRPIICEKRGFIVISLRHTINTRYPSPKGNHCALSGFTVCRSHSRPDTDIGMAEGQARAAEISLLWLRCSWLRSAWQLQSTVFGCTTPGYGTVPVLALEVTTPARR
ncbi:unnamed protein product [Tuber melanosporum]|uniref:(Perigord truffle) hypothetical protein n=1 Tax=Tuber melanosporum (strain Mel28) TaxID=656061 RepID=D5GBU6_TUBMM|nr:uncharacterized protein GSTUM_00005591001 [Tuber melanosporum]CAZ81946.1 unnamed protein product [Tuber melanosporum]